MELRCICLLLTLLSTNLLLPVTSAFTEQKSFFPYPFPDPAHSGTDPSTAPSIGTPPSTGGGGYTPTPSQGGGGSYTPTPSTPSHGGGGGGYTPTPSTPSHGGGGGHTPSTPSHGGGGGYTPTPSTPPGGNCGVPPSQGSTPSSPRTPDPSHGTPSHGGGTTPSTPSHGGGSTPSTPSHGGGYSYPPPTSSGGSPPVPDPGTPTIPSPPYFPAPFPSTGGTCDFWKNHPGLIWGVLGWWGTVGGVFGSTGVSMPGYSPTMSLQEALSNTRRDGLGSLYREGTASLLNSMVNHRFPLNTKQVRERFTAALTSNHAAATQARLFRLANEGRLKPRN